MAGLTKTKSDALPFGNLTKDPTKLPIYRGYSLDQPRLVTSAGVTSTGTTMTSAWGYYGGDSVLSSTLNAYVTVVNLTNLTYPIVIGAMIGRTSNATSDHKFRITVDGVEHIIDTANFQGRLVVGSLFMDSQSTTNGANGRGYPLGYPGVTQEHNGQIRYDTAEQPMHQYQAGYLMLYAERSFKFEDYVSAVLTFSDYNRAYVQYHQLGITGA
tara:strand:- start:347 stop:985 length:639 start_codon:yes stop_codon:yes gene_type:complete